MSEHAPKLTPMMAQYSAIKTQYPDALVMMRLGDFYEMMGEDAERAAPVLEITLTSRPIGKNERTPLCGVPYHAADRYIAKLIAAGFRVAIADQMEDPRKAKGLVKRQVTRVVTPGTVVEEGLLPGHSNNFLVAVFQGGEQFGLAVADVSTGEFLVTELRGQAPRRAMLDEIARLNPAEILLVHDFMLGEEVRTVARGRVADFDPAPDHRNASQRLCEHFGVASLRGFGCEEMDLAQHAAAAVLEYLEGNHLADKGLFAGLATYSTDNFLFLDATARRNLELTSTQWGNAGKSLLQMLDRTQTPGGGRLLRQWVEHPLLDGEAIRTRQDAVAEFVSSTILRHDAAAALKGIADLPRLVSRAATGAATPRDMAALRDSLARVPELAGALDGCASSLLCVLHEALDPCDDLRALLLAAIVDDPPLKMMDGGFIRAGFDADLDRLRDMAANGRQYIANLEAEERERSGIKNLRVGYNGVFGYYLEVSKSNVPMAPDDWIRKQTTANGERYVTPKLKEFENAVLGADERIAGLEADLFRTVREAVAAQGGRLLALSAALSQVDALLSLAQAAVENRYCRPTVNAGDTLRIVGGRHPVVERTQAEAFIPNDTRLDANERLMVLTGPNMSGKSTFLRQTALIVLMAQMGSFVPAEAAEVGLVDRIFTRIGAHDDLASGQSTFMVEMTETANILANATERSLVILDEIGRGTSTYDGLSIAWAVVEHLADVGCKTLFATHYHHLNDLERQREGVRNYRIAVREDGRRILWLRKIIRGGTDKSYGIQVARMAGLPGSVIERAQEVLTQLEGNGKPPAKVEKVERVQLSLFEAEEPAMVTQLRALDVDTLSPIEALNLLHQWKNEAR
ncbi:MAG TPA: DNA mismatch repair protein MutS [Armatimonadota bacterium]|jgi:DNA mismatch repair protein MutS